MAIGDRVYTQEELGKMKLGARYQALITSLHKASSRIGNTEVAIEKQRKAISEIGGIEEIIRKLAEVKVSMVTHPMLAYRVNTLRKAYEGFKTARTKFESPPAKATPGKTANNTLGAQPAPQGEPYKDVREKNVREVAPAQQRISQPALTYPTIEHYATYLRGPGKDETIAAGYKEDVGHREKTVQFLAIRAGEGLQLEARIKDETIGAIFRQEKEREKGGRKEILVERLEWLRSKGFEYHSRVTQREAVVYTRVKTGAYPAGAYPATEMATFAENCGPIFDIILFSTQPQRQSVKKH